MTDAFAIRRPRPLGSFHGRVSIEPGDLGHDNYYNILMSGYDVMIFLDGRLERECVAADPAEGWVVKHRQLGWTLIKDVIKGRVEIKLKKKR